jgi:membrane protein
MLPAADAPCAWAILSPDTAMFNLMRLTILRVRKERLAQVAGSLTFTTLLSVVPLLAVSLALLSRFSALHRFEGAIDEYVMKGLLPADISRTILRYLTLFSGNARSLTWVGSLSLLFTAVALLFTVENALNQMWQVKRNRPFFRRVGMYLLVLAAGPPVLGLCLWATSYVLGVSMGLIGVLPPSFSFVLGMGPPMLVMAALTAFFHFVPNAKVAWGHAVVGALIATAALEMGKRGFAAYLVRLPTYRAVYGSFAAFPLFLLWVYFSWLVTLIAAMIAANLSLKPRRGARNGAAAGASARRQAG